MSKRQALLLAVLGVGCVGTGVYASKHATPTAHGPAAVTAEAPVPRPYGKKVALPAVADRGTPPGLSKARGWLNTTRTPTDGDLRGRIVVVDFWTSCCINCMHALPVLARLEKKHAHDPFLVVGVHTQKFDAEPEVERLRASVIRYGVTHPVAIDGDRGIWESWGVSAWPTILVLDAKGRVIYEEAGEPNEAAIDAVIETALAEGSEEGSLAKTAATFVGREVDPQHPLVFPEKIAKIPGGFAIADSGHDRIVLTDESGKTTATIGGGRGFADGSFASARFAHPQGLVAKGDFVFVADTENHAVRAIDRKAMTVTTLAGTGELGSGRLSNEIVDGKKTQLRSPWDVAVVGDTLYVALAGSHQIATLDPATHKLQLFAGTGQEYLSDGSRLKATFAQPSGLATDGKDLFVLDSETSSVRKIELASGDVSTLVGHGLFVFGDKDGDGDKARLQHPIGLTWADGALFVADTYNSKIKKIDPKSGTTFTLAGGADHKMFFEPAGLAPASSGTLLVADTDHDRIVKLTIATGAAEPWGP
jgi:DNA-binding beta-propeller fold protein YncE/thiol-disulfide isomerase/thioredoxin